MGNRWAPAASTSCQWASELWEEGGPAGLGGGGPTDHTEATAGGASGKALQVCVLRTLSSELAQVST